MSRESEAFGRLGEIVLEAKADKEGNMVVVAPTVPIDQTCKILACMLIDLIFQPKESVIAKPSLRLPEGFPGGKPFRG